MCSVRKRALCQSLVYGLAVALLLSVVALYGFWRRSASSEQHWSEGLAEPVDFPSSQLHDQDSVLVPVAELAELSEPVAAPRPMRVVDIEIDLTAPSTQLTLLRRHRCPRHPSHKPRRHRFPSR